MRKIVIVTLLGCLIGLALSGCKKNNNNYAGSLGCITRTIPSVSDVYLSPAAFDTAKILYQANGLLLQIHQPVDIRYDSTASGDLITIIDSRHFLNGLLIIDGAEHYNFVSGRLSDSAVYQDNGLPENADSTARIGLDDLRKMFLDSHPDNYSVENIAAGKTNVTHWADSCIVATLCYSEKWIYDANVPPNSDIYLKIWSIYTQSRGLFQRVAAIRDDNGKVIPEKYSRVIFP